MFPLTLKGAGVRMKQSVSQLKEKYVDCPKVSAFCETDGKKFCVTRHYGNGDGLAHAIFQLAVKRADRETGI